MKPVFYLQKTNMNNFNYYLNKVRMIKESFGTDRFEQHAIGFMNTYGPKYINNDASILEYLQNHDEDNSSEQNVIKLKEILNNSFASYKDSDDDTIHLIPINGSRIEYFVEYVGDNAEIKKYVLTLNSKDWVKSLDGYLYFVTDIKNRLNYIKENVNNDISAQYKPTITIVDESDVDNNLTLSLGLITDNHVYYHNPEGDELYCYDRNMNLLYTTGYQLDEIFMDDINSYLWASPAMLYNIQCIKEEEQNENATATFNVMAMVVPPFENWGTINMSSTVGDINYTIEYMDNTYCIAPGDVELVKANIGKEIRFKYDASQPLRYMHDIATKKL